MAAVHLVPIFCCSVCLYASICSEYHWSYVCVGVSGKEGALDVALSGHGH